MNVARVYLRNGNMSDKERRYRQKLIQLAVLTQEIFLLSKAFTVRTDVVEEPRKLSLVKVDEFEDDETEEA